MTTPQATSFVGWLGAIEDAVDASVERLRNALTMYDQHRTTMQSLASSVGAFLRDYAALAQQANKETQ